MMKRQGSVYSVMLAVSFCALAMSVVDGVIQPGYAVKSAIKLCLFALIPLGYFAAHRAEFPAMKNLFKPAKTDILTAVCLGLGVYGLIVGGYFLITRFVDLTDMILKLTAQSGVSAANFVAVSLYISIINSFLEEFLFRGFAFFTLKKSAGRKLSYCFSAAAFSLYHFGMISGTVNIPVWIVTLTGLFLAGCVLNWLNEKSGNIYMSWLVHMFANFGINTVGFMIFGMI